MDLYRKNVIAPLIPAFSALKGMIAGIIMLITTSRGAPINRGVKIIFITTIARVWAIAPQISAKIAVFLDLFFL